MKTALLLAAPLLALSPRQGDVEFTPSVVDRGGYLRVRLLVEGGQAPDAIAAEASVTKAEAGGKPLKFLERLDRLDNEVGRPDSRVVAWVDVEAPAKDVATLDLLEGEVRLLAGGDEKAIRLSGFNGKKARKLRSKALDAVGVEVRAHVTTIDGFRIEGAGEAGEIEGLRLEGTGIDYHSLTEPDRARLVGHSKRGRWPKGAVLVVDVKDAAGALHAVRLEDLEVPKEPAPLAPDRLGPLGVALTIGRGTCHELHVAARSEEFELLDVELQVGDEVVPFDEVMTTVDEPTRLELHKAYPALPKGAELVLTHRDGATWTSVPFRLTDLSIRR